MRCQSTWRAGAACVAAALLIAGCGASESQTKGSSGGTGATSASSSSGASGSSNNGSGATKGAGSSKGAGSGSGASNGGSGAGSSNSGGSSSGGSGAGSTNGGSESQGGSGAGKGKAGSTHSGLQLDSSKKISYAKVPSSSPVKSGTVEIAYRNIAIDPDTVKVKVGSTIKWTNYDSTPHNVQSEGGPLKFSSGNFGEGQSYELKVTEPGVIHYECTLQPVTMNGTIEVVE